MTCVATTYFCKACGRQKGEANHWRIAAFIAEEGKSAIAFAEWDDPRDIGMISRGEAFPVCGDACCHVLLSRWFETKTLEPSRQFISEEKQ